MDNGPSEYSPEWAEKTKKLVYDYLDRKAANDPSLKGYDRQEIKWLFDDVVDYVRVEGPVLTKVIHTMVWDYINTNFESVKLKNLPTFEQFVLEQSRNKFKNNITESLDALLKMEIEPDKDKPSIFQYTIYRLPTDEELKEFESHPNLTAKEIMNGFGYTMIGRGITSNKNIQMIKEAIQMLIERYPDDNRYKKALELASNLKSHFAKNTE